MLARGLLLLSLYAEFGTSIQAQGAICSSGIFPALKQTLGSYPEVLAYCEAHYPVAPATVFKRNARSKCKPRPSTTTAQQQPSPATTSVNIDCCTIYDKLDLGFIHCTTVYNEFNISLIPGIHTSLIPRIDVSLIPRIDISLVHRIDISLVHRIDISLVHRILFSIDDRRPIHNYGNVNILLFDFNGGPCAYRIYSTLQQWRVY
ncbi:unnamed protein product [Clonostachys rosea]|uniref:Uncharacterized protein n=1 Tax=Bionectria ochroleuca TaxID=29856 RepID=A0ABY6U9V6_BIOOC|nr:unnamed protein product [Clonostachys rosea]